MAVVTGDQVQHELSHLGVVGQERRGGFDEADGQQFMSAPSGVSGRIAGAFPRGAALGHLGGFGERFAGWPGCAASQHGLKPWIGFAQVVEPSRAGDGVGQGSRQSAADGMAAGDSLHAGQMGAQRYRPAVAVRSA